MAFIQLSDTRDIDTIQSITVGTGETSDWYGLPNRVDYVAMSLIVAGTARVEYTLDAEGAKADTAVAIAWPKGDVTSNSDDLARGISAIRVVSTTGAATLHIRANRG